MENTCTGGAARGGAEARGREGEGGAGASQGAEGEGGADQGSSREGAGECPLGAPTLEHLMTVPSIITHS